MFVIKCMQVLLSQKKTELKVIKARSGKGRDILFFVVKKNITARKEWKTA